MMTNSIKIIMIFNDYMYNSTYDNISIVYI